MGLNVSLAPFDDGRVRRALNYAVDRERLSELTGGLGIPTCQILPPNFSAYEPYCPYTRHPSKEGGWERPDMVKALRLVEASGTAGTRITVWTNPFFPLGAGTEVGSHVVHVLNQLGFRATLKEIEGLSYFDEIFDPGNKVQVFLWGWLPDYPEASAAIAPLFNATSPKTCRGSATAISTTGCNRRGS